MEARQYQLQLAGIGIDVADGEDAGRLAFKARRVHRDQVFVQVDAELCNRPQLDGSWACDVMAEQDARLNLPKSV